MIGHPPGMGPLLGLGAMLDGLSLEDQDGDYDGSKGAFPRVSRAIYIHLCSNKASD